MLTLALVGLLAAAAPEPLPRVPGMRLRLGMEESAVLALGDFAEVKASDHGTMKARQGAARFFGVPGEATCYLKDGRLARVRFEAMGVSRHSQDYVDGQLRMQLGRQCERDLPGDRTCDWTGPRVRVHTEMKKDGLVARVDPWPPPEEPPADSLRAAKATPARGTQSPSRSAADSLQAVSATTPRGPNDPSRSGATSPPSARPPSTAAARVGAASGGPAPTPPPPATVKGPALVPTVRAVVTLPETLKISLVSRNAPDVWPRIISSPPLSYPEAARRESIQGVVWVLALVNPSGQVLDAWVERGIPELDTAALVWVSRSRFAPCERSGAPCRFHVRVAVLFTLH